MDPNRKKVIRALVLGGVLPVVAFSVIEDRFGTTWGLVAGMVFGVGEIFYEWRTQGKVDPITWGGNGLLLVLGGVSLISGSGIWFKLQPSLIEGAMTLMLWASLFTARPLLVMVMERNLAQQGQSLATLGAKGERMGVLLRGFTFRIGLFFCLHAILAAWAALHWSTGAWALLKGVGFTGSMIAYGVVETFLLRYRIASYR